MRATRYGCYLKRIPTHAPMPKIEKYARFYTLPGNVDLTHTNRTARGELNGFIRCLL